MISIQNLCAIFWLLTLSHVGAAPGQHSDRYSDFQGLKTLSEKLTSGVVPIKAGSQRRPDILNYCEQYIKSMAELYERTDSARGETSEQGKLEAARQAISIWWYLWGELMLWAQSHLAGYEMLKSHSDLRERLANR
ncbi:MAG TPA: hypothetical protein VLX09_12950 [Stellaceae bacterium]|nr:hypothetical protein [Stellaceae bacterium]